VSILRAFLTRHCWLFASLAMAALLMKALIPTGYMPGMSGNAISIQLCGDQGMKNMLIEIPGKPGNHEGSKQNAADGTPCAFAGLATPGLAAVDPILLALAIIFVLAAIFRKEAQIIPWRGSHLRPPSQGPPVLS
jgi:hypothetical protein